MHSTPRTKTVSRVLALGKTEKRSVLSGLEKSNYDPISELWGTFVRYGDLLRLLAGEQADLRLSWPDAAAAPRADRSSAGTTLFGRFVVFSSR